MLKIFDVQCKKCKKITEILIESGEVFPKCEECGGDTEQVFAKMSFKLKYNPRTDRVGWSWDGYARSQYWKDVDEAKARGEDVMPATELDSTYDPTDIKNK